MGELHPDGRGNKRDVESQGDCTAHNYISEMAAQRYAPGFADLSMVAVYVLPNKLRVSPDSQKHGVLAESRE